MRRNLDEVNSNGTITEVQSGLCLDVTGASSANGAKVELWTCNGDSNQQWTLCFTRYPRIGRRQLQRPIFLLSRHEHASCGSLQGQLHTRRSRSSAARARSDFWEQIMPRCHANGIEIEYDTFGAPSDPALLLVMGLSMQLTGWEPDLCKRFADRGFYVIRYDNRDAGLSTHFDSAPVPNLGAVLSGDASDVRYLLADMADDAAGLLDALGIQVAHVVGASMGGMIVQELMLRHPERLLSACSIMSTTGSADVGHPSPDAAATLLAPAPTSRAEAIEQGVATWRILQSPAYPTSEQVLREQEAAFYDRCYYPDGGVRQLVAILCSPDRTDALKTVSTPTLVLHGEADPLINVTGGRATAAAVPDSILRTYPGMGHDLPVELWDTFVDEIVANSQRARR